MNDFEDFDGLSVDFNMELLLGIGQAADLSGSRSQPSQPSTSLPGDLDSFLAQVHHFQTHSRSSGAESTELARNSGTSPPPPEHHAVTRTSAARTGCGGLGAKQVESVPSFISSPSTSSEEVKVSEGKLDSGSLMSTQASESSELSEIRPSSWTLSSLDELKVSQGKLDSGSLMSTQASESSELSEIHSSSRALSSLDELKLSQGQMESGSLTSTQASEGWELSEGDPSSATLSSMLPLTDDDEEIVDSLLRALEEVTERAVFYENSDEPDCCDGSEMLTMLEAPLENFHNLLCGAVSPASALPPGGTGTGTSAVSLPGERDTKSKSKLTSKPALHDTETQTPRTLMPAVHDTETQTSLSTTSTFHDTETQTSMTPTPAFHDTETQTPMTPTPAFHESNDTDTRVAMTPKLGFSDMGTQGLMTSKPEAVDVDTHSLMTQSSELGNDELRTVDLLGAGTMEDFTNVGVHDAMTLISELDIFQNEVVASGFNSLNADIMTSTSRYNSIQQDDLRRGMLGSNRMQQSLQQGHAMSSAPRSESLQQGHVMSAPRSESLQQGHVMSAPRSESLQQGHVMSSAPRSESLQQGHVMSAPRSESLQQGHVMSAPRSESLQQGHAMSSAPRSESLQQGHAMSSAPRSVSVQPDLITSRFDSVHTDTITSMSDFDSSHTHVMTSMSGLDSLHTNVMPSMAGLESLHAGAMTSISEFDRDVMMVTPTDSAAPRFSANEPERHDSGLQEKNQDGSAAGSITRSSDVSSWRVLASLLASDDGANVGPSLHINQTNTTDGAVNVADNISVSPTSTTESSVTVVEALTMTQHPSAAPTSDGDNTNYPVPLCNGDTSFLMTLRNDNTSCVTPFCNDNAESTENAICPTAICSDNTSCRTTVFDDNTRCLTPISNADTSCFTAGSTNNSICLTPVSYDNTRCLTPASNDNSISLTPVSSKNTSRLTPVCSDVLNAILTTDSSASQTQDSFGRTLADNTHNPASSSTSASPLAPQPVSSNGEPVLPDNSADPGLTFATDPIQKLDLSALSPGLDDSRFAFASLKGLLSAMLSKSETLPHLFPGDDSRCPDPDSDAGCNVGESPPEQPHTSSNDLLASEEQSPDGLWRGEGSSTARQDSPKSAEKASRARRFPSEKMLPPCRVCGQPASGIHYGVKTCEACKGFFRRSLVRTLPYKCKGNKKCNLRESQRSLCASCRYKRCLEVGMSPEGIKTGRYSHEMRTQNTLEVRRLKDAQTCSGPVCPNISDSHLNDLVARLMEADRLVLTNNDVPDEVLERWSRQVHDSHKLQQETFRLRVLTQEEYDEVYRRTGVDVDGRKKLIEFYAKFMDRNIRCYVRFTKGIPEFHDLALNDQANLLKRARAEFWFLSSYRGFHTEYRTFYAPNGVVLNHTQYRQMVGEESSDYQFKMAEKIRKLGLTREELVLVKAVCLTYTDQCQLEEPGKVQKIQYYLLKALHVLLARRHDNPNLALARALDMLVSLRDMSEMDFKSNSRSLVLEVLREYPMLMQVLVNF